MEFVTNTLPARKTGIFPLKNFFRFLCRLCLDFSAILSLTERREEEMNYDGLITAVLFVFAGITAVNLVIQFFQFAAEERKKCSIIRTEPKNIKKVKFCGPE